MKVLGERVCRGARGWKRTGGGLIQREAATRPSCRGRGSGCRRGFERNLQARLVRRLVRRLARQRVLLLARRKWVDLGMNLAAAVSNEKKLQVCGLTLIPQKGA